MYSGLFSYLRMHQNHSVAGICAPQIPWHPSEMEMRGEEGREGEWMDTPILDTWLCLWFKTKNIETVYVIFDDYFCCHLPVVRLSYSKQKSILGFMVEHEMV